MTEKQCVKCGDKDSANFYQNFKSNRCRKCSIADSKAYRDKIKPPKVCKICGETDQQNFYTTTKAHKCKKCLLAIQKERYGDGSNRWLPEYKVCNTCGEEDQTKFHATLCNQKCKTCISVEAKEKRRLNPLTDEQKKERSVYSLKHAMQWSQIFKTRAIQAKGRAKKLNVPYDISGDYLKKLFIEQDGKCFYSGIEMTNETDRKFTLSVDRIDGKDGYTTSNVVLTCSIINTMKSGLSKEEFFYLIEKILSRKEALLAGG